MGDYRSLRVWQVAHELTLSIYEATASFPSSELYGMTSQIRRAAASVPANLAEGCGRDSDGELGRFSRIALGSANELDYHLLLARDLGLMESSMYSSLHGETSRVKKMLARLIDSLTTDSRRPTADDR
jgi:four helix bundle protein